MTRSETPSHADPIRSESSQDPADDAGDPTAPGDVNGELAKVQAEAAELRDAWLRAKAETDNVRKIAQADVAKAHKYAAEKFAEDMLPVKDALEQTLAAAEVSVDTLKAGAELTLKALQAAFGRARVMELDPVGEKFNPHRHQAMQMVPSDLPANSVVAVFQKGYMLNDRVLRPALVTVAQERPPGV